MIWTGVMDLRRSIVALEREVERLDRALTGMILAVGVGFLLLSIALRGALGRTKVESP